jgi:dolichol-phosphate mannosyltransferase
VKPVLSVIVPVGRAEPCLAELLRQVDETCAACGRRCEVLLVGWGQGREAAKAAAGRQLDACGGEARALQLAGASGAAAAIAAGLRRATGEMVLILDARGTLRPADLLAALARLAEGVELVVARRPGGAADGLRRRAADLLLGAPASSPGPLGLVLMVREVARALPLYGNLHLLLPAVARHWGVAVADTALPAAPAPQGPAAVPGLGDLLAAFFLLRFARLPLRFFGPIGVLLLLLGLAVDGVLVYQKLAQGQAMSDRPLLLLGTLLLVLGIQALSLGLVAELIVFIHARKLRDYRIGGEWTGAAEETWAGSQAGSSSAARHAAGAAE